VCRQRRKIIPDAQQALIKQYLCQALTNQELYLNYQPQYNNRLKKIVAFEALIRWKHPVLGEVAPDLLIKVAEATGLIIPIGEWVLRTACQFIRKVHWEGDPDCRIAVNISVIQLLEDDLRGRLSRILQEVGLPASYLELELTETLPFEPLDHLSKQLRLLKADGVRIALDDFGIGYATLDCLKQLWVDTLKIDKSFVADLIVCPKTRFLTECIISLGRSLGLRVIAEGVETQDQVDWLAKLECHLFQGYFYGKPVNECDALRMVKNERDSFNCCGH
jgi:EAL domain-containing protein (putative c-di-GMP-specific phosphodiesterase class I)